MKTFCVLKMLSPALAAVGLTGCGVSYADYGYSTPVYGYSQSYTSVQPTYAHPYSAPQYATPSYPQSYSTTNPVDPAATVPALLAEHQLDQLTGPIALYPDPLLAIVLPAATFPQDVSAAATWLQTNPNPTDEAINVQPWDASVKGLVRYPTVLNQLAGNMEWTQALGAAFINQEQDVMNSIQRLRTQAQAAGNLQTTLNQVVIAQPGAIEILPPSPELIYVPVYDPYIVYYRPCPVTFSRFTFGAFLDFGFDWHGHRICRGYDWRRSHHGRDRHDWRDRDWRDRDWRDRTWASSARPWVRDRDRPAPVMPQRFVRPDSRDNPLVGRTDGRTFDGRTGRISDGRTLDGRTFDGRSFEGRTQPNPTWQNRTGTPVQPRVEQPRQVPPVQPRVEQSRPYAQPKYMIPQDKLPSNVQRPDRFREAAPSAVSRPPILPSQPTVRSAPSPAPAPVVRSAPAPSFRSEPTVRSAPSPTFRSAPSAPPPTIRSIPSAPPTVRSTPSAPPSVRSEPPSRSFNNKEWRSVPNIPDKVQRPNRH